MIRQFSNKLAQIKLCHEKALSLKTKTPSHGTNAESSEILKKQERLNMKRKFLLLYSLITVQQLEFKLILQDVRGGTFM